METRKVTKKNKVWIVGYICFTLVIHLLLAGCNQGILTSNDLRGGPYPPLKDLPVVLADHESGSHYMGSIEVTGSKKAALKQAAKLGARAVKLQPAQLEIEVIVYDWSDGQRPIGTETKLVPGHSVSLYLNR